MISIETLRDAAEHTQAASKSGEKSIVVVNYDIDKEELYVETTLVCKEFGKYGLAIKHKANTISLVYCAPTTANIIMNDINDAIKEFA